MALLILMYAQVHIYVALLIAPYSFIPQAWRRILVVQFVAHVVYYACTLPGDPAVTGCRKSAVSMAWLRSKIGPVLEWWMRGCKVCTQLLYLSRLCTRRCDMHSFIIPLSEIYCKGSFLAGVFCWLALPYLWPKASFSSWPEMPTAANFSCPAVNGQAQTPSVPLL